MLKREEIGYPQPPLEITETDTPNETKEVSTKVKVEEHKLNEIISQNTKHVIKENKGN